MSSEPLYAIGDTEPERAGFIVANYLDSRYGAVPLRKLERALSEIFRLYRIGIRHPLLLANKAIELVERPEDHSKAA